MKDEQKSRRDTVFQPGKSGNPTGKPKGVQNRVTTQMKETFALIFENNASRIQSDLDQLEPRDRLKFFIDLAPYFMPKLNAVRAEISVKHTGVENLNTEELEKLIIELNSTENEQ